MDNIVEFKVTGKYALFTDPLTKIGGEKCSYQIPTYEALKGIISSVYWKPTIVWIIDKVRVMRPIKTQTRSTKPIDYGRGISQLAIYTYLADVEYKVQAHFKWNMKRPDMEEDRNENKHFCVAQRMIERGGRRDVFLGARECQGYVEPCTFLEGQGSYDDIPELAFGWMFHGFDYPDEKQDAELHARLWRAEMRKGIIEFPRPEACTRRRLVRPMKADPPASIGLCEEGLLEGCEETEVAK